MFIRMYACMYVVHDGLACIFYLNSCVDTQAHMHAFKQFTTNKTHAHPPTHTHTYTHHTQKKRAHTHTHTHKKSLDKLLIKKTILI
jgi:hypothetical protein